jgi:hypothetical protein
MNPYHIIILRLVMIRTTWLELFVVSNEKNNNNSFLKATYSCSGLNNSVRTLTCFLI